jgi:uncharacterized protein involved in exopolysaccharide biosynthesis
MTLNMPEIETNSPSVQTPGNPSGGSSLLPSYSCLRPPDDEITVRDLLRVLRRRWRIITLVTILGTSGAIAYAFNATPIFLAQAVIAPPEQKKAGGASAALAALGSLGGLGAEIAGGMGISLGGNDANRLESLLKSHRLTARVVTKHDLLPVLFAKKWAPETKQWKVADPDDVPNVWDAEKALKKIFTVKNDPKNGLLALSCEFENVQTAEKILHCFLDELALLIQEDELRKIQTNKRFAEDQLRRAGDPTIIAKLQGLLSEQVEKEMMARNVEHSAYELIDPPAGSDRKVKPQRALIGALGLTTSLFGGVLLAFLIDWMRTTGSIES